MQYTANGVYAIAKSKAENLTALNGETIDSLLQWGDWPYRNSVAAFADPMPGMLTVT